MITRNAILISCPEGSQYLYGAVRDIENMFNYLTSPKGGDFKKDEIVQLHSPTWAEAKKHIDHHKADYQLIYFAGHGFAGENKERYLSFKDGGVEDLLLLNSNPKQLIIVDACRVFYPTISGISPAEDVFSGFTGDSLARQVFDRCIQNSANGKLIVHATEHGFEAMEERYHRGGLFTLSLLLAAKSYDTGLDNFPVSIQTLLAVAMETMVGQGYAQYPNIPFKIGDLTVPFLIDAEEMVVEPEPQNAEVISVVTSQTKANKINWLGIASAALLITAIFKSIND
jgi:hypothetical protein